MIKKFLSKLKKKDSKRLTYALSKKGEKKTDKAKVAKELVKKATKKPAKKTAGKKVVVYSTHTCPWCMKTKEFLKANKVSYTNKFVDSSKAAAQEMISKSGQQSVPVVLVGDKVIVGFSEGKLKKALGL